MGLVDGGGGGEGGEGEEGEGGEMHDWLKDGKVFVV